MGDENKVKFGFSNVYYAIEADDSTDENPKWDTPLRLPGVVTFEPEAEAGEYKFYADNIVYYGTYSDNGYSGDLEVAKFPAEFLAKILGWEIDTNDGLLEVQNGPKKNFALLGQVEGDKYGRRFVFFKCTGSKPSTSYKTNEDNIEVQTETMSITCNPVNIGDGKMVTKYSVPRSEEGTAVYDAFFEKVYVPTLTPPTP